MKQPTDIQYDFDEVIERHGTDAYKYTYVKDVCGREDVLAMWVADMDFATPPFVLDVVRRRAAQRVLGYTCSTPAYRQSIVDWYASHYDWHITADQINYVPGVVAGIYLAIQTFTEKGDRILIQDPVYHPFRIVPEGSGREIVWNHLRRTDDSFEMDLEALRRDVKGCRVMILCNPHNPAGICWSRETLQAVAHICKEEGVLVISDEIHCDMLLGGRRHIPFATVSDEAASNCITLGAPSKTFNMPGIVCSQAVVLEPKLRRRYFSYIENSDMDLGNVFCYECATACYSAEGDNWRQQMLQYVEGNVEFLIERLAPVSHLIKVIRPEASFLVFLDCRGLMAKLSPLSETPVTHDAEQESLVRFFADECDVCFNPGNMFGQGGKGYMRMNVGCPRSTIEQAVEQILAGLMNI